MHIDLFPLNMHVIYSQLGNYPLSNFYSISPLQPKISRRLAHFLASVLQKVDKYARKLGSKYVGKILKNVKGNRWPFDFWEPDQPQSPAGELEVNLLKTFTRIHLSLVNEKESTAIKQYICEGKCDILEGIGDSDDDGDAGDRGTQPTPPVHQACPVE
jgi:hypothetical protein